MKKTVLAVFCTSLLCAGAAAQGYPEKPIRVPTTAAGGPNDLVARLITDGAMAGLGQRMVVENRAIVGVEVVAKAPPDGYTLLHYTSVLWLMPLVRDASWDPVADFSPITLTFTQPSIVVVHPSVPVKSIKELIAFAKARPGALNYASSSTGATNHVGAQLFKSMAGVDLLRINYKGGDERAAVEKRHGSDPGLAGSVCATIKADMARMEKVVRQARLRE